jgi:pyruvate dehydrogenase E1 component alpha subunit
MHQRRRSRELGNNFLDQQQSALPRPQRAECAAGNGREAVSELTALQLRSLYVAMVRTRLIDTQVTVWQRQGRAGFHIGSLGEEACIIASAAAMRDHDWLFPSYREFGALLMRGMPLSHYLGNIFGNALDPAKGRQMPDHYTGRPYRFGCVSSPLATQLPQAVGFAWAARARGEDTVVGVYFGEGATSTGEFHAGLNFAGVYKTPNVFLLRNNRWAISMPSNRQTASETYSQKASAYGIRGVQCDGDDVRATHAAVSAAVMRAASGGGPTLVEMLTYRLSGHSTADDPSVYRGEGDMPARAADPVLRLRTELERLGHWSPSDEDALISEVRAELSSAGKEAEGVGPPALSTMFDDVYQTLPEHLIAQRSELSGLHECESA